MPLVQFQFVNGEDLNIDDASQSDILFKFTQKVTLPRRAMNKRWWLRSFNANTFHDNENTWRWVDINLPELMTENHTFYSLNSEGTATPPPNRGLRFYVNNIGMEQQRFESEFKSISTSPNLNLGTHRLDSLELTLVISAVFGSPTAVNAAAPFVDGYTLILEYE